MNACFIFPPVYLPIEGTKLTPPLGIYLLQNILQKNHIEAQIVPAYAVASECKNKDELTRVGFQNNPAFLNAVRRSDVLGLSCDSFNYGIGKIMIQNAKQIRRNIKVIIGGVHATIFDEHVLKNSGADIVVRGEGEMSILEVLHALEDDSRLEKIEGITYLDRQGKIRRNPDRQKLNATQIEEHYNIDFSSANLQYYHGLPLETSRGCPYNCIFCSVVHKRNWRPLSADFIQQRLIELSQFTTNIVLVDDAFTINTERAIQILEFAELSDLPFQLTFEARVNNLVAAPILNTISPHKIKKIQIGVESGYPEGLERIGKKITIEQVEEVARRARDKNVASKILASFIIGFPWESVKDCLRTYEFANSLKNEYGLNTVVNWWLPIPSALWHEVKQEAGFHPAMYDDPEWAVHDDIFSQAHPKISLKDKAKINFLIMNSRPLHQIPTRENMVMHQ